MQKNLLVTSENNKFSFSTHLLYKLCQSEHWVYSWCSGIWISSHARLWFLIVLAHKRLLLPIYRYLYRSERSNQHPPEWHFNCLRWLCCLCQLEMPQMKLCSFAQILLCKTVFLHEKPGDFQSLQVLWVSLFTSEFIYICIFVLFWLIPRQRLWDLWNSSRRVWFMMGSY